MTDEPPTPSPLDYQTARPDRGRLSVGGIVARAFYFVSAAVLIAVGGGCVFMGLELGRRTGATLDTVSACGLLLIALGVGGVFLGVREPVRERS